MPCGHFEHLRRSFPATNYSDNEKYNVLIACDSSSVDSEPIGEDLGDFESKTFEPDAVYELSGADEFNVRHGPAGLNGKDWQK